MAILLPRSAWTRQPVVAGGLIAAFDGSLASDGPFQLTQTTAPARWSGTRGVLVSAAGAGAPLTSGKSLSGDRTVMLFARLVDASPTSVWFTSSSASGVGYWLGTSGNVWTVGGGLNAPAGSAPNGSDQVVFFRRIGTTDSIWVNGVLVASGNSGTGDGTGLTFLSFGTSGFEIVAATGGLYQGAAWGRALDDNTIAVLSRQLLSRRVTPLVASRTRRDWPKASVGGGGSITAALAVTDAADSLSASGTLAIAAQAAITDAADSLSGIGALSIVADASISDAGDSLAAVGSLGGLTVDLAVTDAADSISAEAVLAVAAVAALVDAADSLTGSGSLALVAQAGVTDAADSLSASVGLAIVAELAVSDSSDSLTSEVTVGGVVASASMTDAADSLLAEAQLGAVVEQPPSLGWRSRRIEDIPNEAIEAQARLVDGDDIIVSGVDVGLALRGSTLRDAMADLSDDDDVMSGAGMLLPMFVRGPDGLLRPVSSAKTAFYCVCDQCGGFKPAGSLAS